MNLRNLLFLFSAIAIPSVGLGQTVQSNDRVRVEVRVITDTDHKDIKNATADTVTQKKELVILLSGKAKPNDTRVVKWAAYGRNLKSNDVMELDSGEAKIAFDSVGQQKVETRSISTTYTPSHSVVSRSSGRRGSNNNTSRSKRVEAEGKKFAGYIVRVMEGATVVGEASEPANLAQQRDK